MPFHPAVGASYRGGLPAGLSPISFGGEPIEDVSRRTPGEAPPVRVIDERQPGGLFYKPPTPVPLALVGLGLAAVAALIYAAFK